MESNQRRILDRLSIRATIILVLCALGLSAIAGASLLYRYLAEDNVKSLISQRGDDALHILATAEDPEHLATVATALSASEAVDSVAFVALDRTGAATGENSTFASDSQPSPQIESLLSHYVESGRPDRLIESTTVVDRIEVADPPPSQSAAAFAVAVEVNRDAIVSAQPLSALGFAVFIVAAIVAMSAALYLVLLKVLIDPLRTLSSLDIDEARRIDVNTGFATTPNEIARTKNLIGMLARESESKPERDMPTDYLVPDSLPDVWLVVDRQLRVVDSRFALSDQNGEEVVTLALNHVSDLLSADVVDYLRQTVQILSPGETDEFEFAVGVKSYIATVRADSQDYVLEIAESPADIHAVQPPSTDASELLEALLTNLPFGIVEAADDASILFAYGQPFDAADVEDLVDRSLVELLPSSAVPEAQRAFRDARFTLETQSFDIDAGRTGEHVSSRNYVVPISLDDKVTYFVMSVPTTPSSEDEESAEKVAALEENLWSLELKLSQYENEIASLEEERSAFATLNGGSENEGESQVDADIGDSAARLLRALAPILATATQADSQDEETELQRSAATFAGIIDERLGTEYSTIVSRPTGEPDINDSSKFHLATFLDEIAIEATEVQFGNPMRLSVFIQPSLPKSLYGAESTARQAVLQMIEFARIVAQDRPLTVAALQDTSEGNLVRVRFEVQIPPPALEDDDIALLRGCISGDLPESGVSEGLRSALNSEQPAEFEALDVEVVKIMRDTVAIRCSADFEIAEDIDTDYAWVRGLRTLIIQDFDSSDNGIQTSLGALGIIGYVVSSGQALAEALRTSEENANPYRLVLADADTPRLDEMASPLLGGDAPVVLVGPRNDSAMVSAIASGYSGYVSKPVRQVEMLEVILSTVDPADESSDFQDPVLVTS